MLWVVDKKVVKHALNVGVALVEVPIRIRFEFGLDNQRFAPGSMKRDFLYNRAELLRRFPRLRASEVDAEIESVVDQALVEHLKFAGYAHGEVELTPSEAPEPDADDMDAQQDSPPDIVLARTIREHVRQP